MGSANFRLFRRIVATLLLWVVGCSTSSGHSPGLLGNGKLGAICQQTEDCASGICVRLGEASGICSTTCATDGDCPQADNWGCLAGANTSLLVCGCRRLAKHEVCGDGIDNDCDAKVDDCRVCDGVGVPDDDHENCGACGNACRAEQQCTDGACVCPAGTTDCGHDCVDTSTSVSDCGACGNTCGVGETCTAGTCRCRTEGESSCPAVGCVALTTDVNNCGSCGNDCTLGRVCADGKCGCPEQGAPDFCDATGCVNLVTDAKNCGKCGQECGAGLTCIDGACACPEGKKQCDGICVATQTDDTNCGECGQACGAGQTCVEGACGCDAAGYTLCGGECVNQARDVAHCGSCARACAAGEVCTGGRCACESLLYCNENCMTETDTSNCGACGRACSPSQVCSAGSCVCQGFGLSPCGNSCVDLSSDESNCGGCLNACRSGEQCYSGHCQCPVGQTYCEAAGSCVNLNSDTKNCGTCGRACELTEVCALGTCNCQAAGALFCSSQNSCVDTQKNAQHCGACDHACRATEACTGGKCGCATYGEVYCAATKACTDTLFDTKHCGDCSKTCRTGELCSYGQCACPGAQQFCDGAKSCVDITSDSKNCAACGKQCGAEQHCAASQCTCNEADLSACGTACYDLQTDSQHCGNCNNACSSPLSCKAGACKCPAPTLNAEVRLTNNTSDSQLVAAAWDGTNVGVAYVVAADASQGVGYNVFFSRIKPDGTVMGTTQITNYSTNVTGVTEAPQLVWTGTEYGLLWSYNIHVSGMPIVMFRRIKPNGGFAAPAVQVAKSEVLEEGGFFYTYRVEHAALAWSSQYGGYAAYYTRAGNSVASVFRRLGVDGTTPDAENSFEELSRTWPNRLVAAPDGTWGIMSDLKLQLINADGSKTTTASTVNVGRDYFFAPPLMHDGQTFVAVGRRDSWPTPPGLFLNRGASTNTPFALIRENSGEQFKEALLSKVGQSLAVGYTRAALGSDYARLALQRFTIPATPTSAVQSLHDSVDIMTTDTVSSRGGDAAIVGTTPGHMLGIWADTRWGHKQLYARDIDLHSCP